MGVEYTCCESEFFIHIVIIVFLVVFAGMMSGLTLGLMSLSLVDLEVLAKSGTPNDRKNAAKILPVVQNQHLLLCTLLICNAAAMEALPIFLDSLITAWGAILISVTLILLFGEIIPQSLCSRHGLTIGATMAPFVRVLVLICFPIAYPIGKLLDYLLGHQNSGLFRRAELKTLVHFHGNHAGKGGELTNDETTIITGALELHEKRAGDAMTPISDIFSIDLDGKLDRDLTNLILEKGHSRIPIYSDQPTNIIGLLLVKNLLTIHPADETLVRNVTIRKIPRVSYTMRLDDILNEFQKGHSHMAVVTRESNKKTNQPASNSLAHNSVEDVRVDIDDERPVPKKSTTSLQKGKSSLPNGGNNSARRIRNRSRMSSKDMYADILRIDENDLPNIPDDEEVVGIITMEDIIEELLQEEIFDETDHTKHL
uniref:Putative metal transporter CNNM4-like n=1 Tax=Solanum chacoense TaxID=4108 RepID=A0A0V0IHV8_SOLCH